MAAFLNAKLVRAQDRWALSSSLTPLVSSHEPDNPCRRQVLFVVPPLEASMASPPREQESDACAIAQKHTIARIAYVFHLVLFLTTL
jgi:hypothetical protein